MKIKRIVALIISTVLLCFTLVGCGDVIGDYLENYDWQPEVVEDVYYDFYIVGEESDDIARRTVNDKLNQTFADKFHTKIYIHYIDVTAEQSYADVINSIADQKPTSAPVGYTNHTYGGKILLINDYAMMDTLASKLSPLDKYLEDTAFAKLNSQLPTPLLSAAEYVDADGKSMGTLAIPNNRRLGEFKYYVINRSIAEEKLSFSAQTELLEMTTPEAVKELTDAADAKGIVNDGNTKYFYETSGGYELKAEIEASGEWICNVAEAPVVTPEIAYGSAFGVIASPNKTEMVTVNKDDGTQVQEERVVLDFTRRAMEIIYSINADVTIRNILQYGVENTNFTRDDNNFVTKLLSEGSKYNMNIEYTGDVTKAYYLGSEWTPALAENVKLHNAKSQLPD